MKFHLCKKKCNCNRFCSFIYVCITLQLIHPLSSASSGKGEQAVKFYYYLDNGTPEEINTNDIHSTRFRPNEPLFVIVDGFLSHLNANMTVHTKNAIFQYKPRSNVISLDWSKLSGYGKLRLDEKNALPLVMSVYNEAKSRVRVVAERLAKFLNDLVLKNCTDFGKMHLIGYSLGAHIAGVAGSQLMEKYNGKITRITGLDPAGLGFSIQDKKSRLDKGDAEFVDIYYSSRYSAGDTAYSVGHVDVFLNGGATQPGCESNDLLRSTICNHAYAWKVWNKCVLEKCIACPCDKKDCEVAERRKRDCPNGIPVGINISMDIEGDYYLKMGRMAM